VTGPDPVPGPADLAADRVDVVAAADARVSAALAELDAVDGWPPADQVAAFAESHQALQATLAGIDDN
jgi:hypothetical protein